MDAVKFIVVFFAAMAAGAVNSVAGGGTVFNFSALVWTGLPLIRANATNATSLIPGSLGGVAALFNELKSQWRSFIVLLIPTVIGSLVGAFTVRNTSEAIFRAVVPFLILFATVIFARRDAIVRWLKQRQEVTTEEQPLSTTAYLAGMALQFLISFYGGYFGAGIGILMLTSLSIIGMANMHKMNAIKNALAIAINGTAAVFFIIGGNVEWPLAIVAAIGASIGGYGLGTYAKRMDQEKLRQGVVIAGVVVSIYMFMRLILS
jgi:uncharacterized membrane protein YfcA